MGEIEEKHRKLEDFAHKPSAFPAMLKREVEKIDQRMVKGQNLIYEALDEMKATNEDALTKNE